MEQLGECFITGLSGHELSEDSAQFLSQSRIGGVIFFAHNYKDPLQIARFVKQIQECRTGLPLWISVDQEGGRVQRFKAPFTLVPNARARAQSLTPKQLFTASEHQAKELKAVGINLNFAPVADIQTNPNNPVIGDRAFGSDEDTVSKCVTAYVRGHLTAGVQPCVKHFPGHGDTDLDSHFALPRIHTPLAELKSRELKPFIKAFKSRCNFVMISHVLNEAVDPDYPASLSQKTVTGLLRKDLRYQKIIVTDDMEMQAITDHFGIDQAPVLALNAGCDLLIYRSEKATRAAYTACLKALNTKTLIAENVETAAKRLREIKSECLASETWKPLDDATIQTLVGHPDHGALFGEN